MKAAIGFCIFILALVSFVTTGVFALITTLPGGFPESTKAFVVILVFVTIAFATWGLVNAAWIE